MPALVFIGFPHTGRYQGEHVPAGVVARGTPFPGGVHTGEVEVSEDGAAYLLDTYPSAFLVSASPTKAAKAAKAAPSEPTPESPKGT